MSARTRLSAGPVHGPTHRSAPTESIEIPVNPRRAGGDRAPPLPVYCGAKRRADVPKAWLPPTKFRAEIWGVSHRHRPLRKAGKPHRPPGPVAQSGASAPAVITRGGFGARQRSSPKYPATSDNPSVAVFGRDSSLCTREPFPAGDGRAGGHIGPPLRGHRNSQRRQAGRDRARPLREHWERRSAGRCT